MGQLCWNLGCAYDRCEQLYVDAVAFKDSRGFALVVPLFENLLGFLSKISVLLTFQPRVEEHFLLDVAYCGCS